MIREQELSDMITKNKLNVIFLVETDTSAINTETDFRIAGFKTIIQNKRDISKPTRIVCLTDDKHSDKIKTRMDLTSPDFPSIWIEIQNSGGSNTICGGFYREWCPNGASSIEAQANAMEVFTEQIERATSENKSIIIMGDANLCTQRWDSPSFKYKRIADELRETLTQCGITQIELGPTYLADRLSDDGSEIESCIDHAYVSKDLANKVNSFKLENSATDHLPIVVSYQQDVGLTNPKKTGGSILKRSMKNFTQTRWIDSLRACNWNPLSQITDINDQTQELTNQINQALDECAPFKKIKIRENFRPGLTEKSRNLMMQRDTTRKSLARASKEDAPSLKAKYKNLRNRAINQMRLDTLEQNAKRISEAKNEGETWKVVNDIIRPKSETKITISTPVGDVSDEQEVANSFNRFFVDKIELLKENIDPDYVKDPLEKIKEKIKNKNLNFSVKPVSVKEVTKIMKKMSKKKSKGNDGISQECLLKGLDVLATPLTKIINNSISTGIFPDQWKEAIVVPILKKGDAKELKNYRPVSCLASASKVLEKVVCDQLTRFAESHGLLPTSQHGFRTGRSTMTALSSMQKSWIKNTEEGLMTGILVWDLSSAFDTLDINLFLKKLTLYGSDPTTLSWFESFLTGRSQRVKIGDAMSTALELVSGVPQGGILSPIIFTLYTADMEMWLKSSSLFNFADDTTTDNKSKCKKAIKDRLEEDAVNILNFMASNGLVANKTKTEFLVLNEKKTR